MRRAGRLPLEALAPYLLEPPAPESPAVPVPLEWRRVFGNDHPVEVEVGFGKGMFLVAVSARQPGTNFVGIEIMRKYQLYAATRLAKRGATNVRVVKADARLFFRDFIAGGSLEAVHVYFPDPWWKTRHKKRRVFTADFAAECDRVIRPGGRLHIATDVEEYFGVMTGLVAGRPRFVSVPESPDGPDAPASAQTNFERKYRLQGKPIYRRKYTLTDPAGTSPHLPGACPSPHTSP